MKKWPGFMGKKEGSGFSVTEEALEWAEKNASGRGSAARGKHAAKGSAAKKKHPAKKRKVSGSADSRQLFGAKPPRKGI